MAAGAPRARRARLLRAAAVAALAGGPGAVRAVELQRSAALPGPALLPDGSSYAYWSAVPAGGGAGGGAETWLLWFQGGFACWDSPTCEARVLQQPHLVSSAFWPQGPIRIGGVFDALAAGGAATAYLPYCSSDNWIGENGWADPLGKKFWLFRGRANVEATVEDLLGRGMKRAKTVLVGGCSAGGRGSMYNLDSVCEQVRHANPGVRCAGIHDSPWWLDMAPTAEKPSLRDAIEAGLGIWRAADAGPAPEPLGTCMEAEAGDPAECFFAKSLLPHLGADAFVHASQYDAFQLNYNTGLPYNVALAKAAYEASGRLRAWVEGARGRLKTELGEAFGGGAPAGDEPVRHAFGDACFEHCGMTTAAFFSVAAAQAASGQGSLKGAVEDFVRAVVERGGAGSGRRAAIVDACDGLGCSNGCPGAPIEGVEVGGSPGPEEEGTCSGLRAFAHPSRSEGALERLDAVAAAAIGAALTVLLLAGAAWAHRRRRAVPPAGKGES